MPTLLLRFPGGRYHATPWGHHVNEGLVEWPPSPWRLLRALIACGYSTQCWSEIPPSGRRLFEALAATLPRYRLPSASVAHSRHFMPTTVLGDGREKTTLVFDSWADLDAGTLAVRWECALDAEAAELFSLLAVHLGYLGRSESWVEAAVQPDEATWPVGDDAYPHVDGHRAERGWEQISLMAVESAATYNQWRELAVVKALEPFPLPDGKKKVAAKLAKERALAVAPYPIDLIDSLQRDTAWWKSHQWSQPPGSRRVLYWRRSDALSVAMPAATTTTAPQNVTTMLLALTTPSGNRSALPMLRRALPQAELLHRALIAQAGGGRRTDCPELTGMDDVGNPLTGHQHVHILPVDLDADGHLDHVLIYAPMGLGSKAQHAVRNLKRTWTKGGAAELQLAVAGQGDIDHLRALPARFAKGIQGLLGPRLGARIWQSSTPMVLPRYQKARGANTLSGQIHSELASRGLPPAAVELLPWDEATLPLRHAIRSRGAPAKPPPVDAGFAVRLVFEQPVSGPIALGYGAHFGLGLFNSVDAFIEQSADCSTAPTHIAPENER